MTDTNRISMAGLGDKVKKIFNAKKDFFEENFEDSKINKKENTDGTVRSNTAKINRSTKH